jgi:hypothetical protein
MQAITRSAWQKDEHEGSYASTHGGQSAGPYQEVQRHNKRSTIGRGTYVRDFKTKQSSELNVGRQFPDHESTFTH